jgi:hypothetical protein
LSVLFEVPIEPIREQFYVLRQVRPTVPRARLDDQFRRNARVLEFRHERLGLLDGHQFVRIPVDDQRGRVIRADVRDRRDLPADLQDLRLVRDPLERPRLRVPLVEIERRPEPGEDDLPPARPSGQTTSEPKLAPTL